MKGGPDYRATFFNVRLELDIRRKRKRLKPLASGERDYWGHFE